MRAGIRRAIAIALLSAMMLSLVPPGAEAIPYKIEGYLRDTQGVPITLANITISGMVYDMGVQDYVTSDSYALTDSNGYFKAYVAAIEPGGYNEGSVLTVSYTGEDGPVTTQITVGGLGAWANLTYEEHTSFLDAVSSPAGIITIVLIATAAVVLYLILRVPKEDDAGKGQGGDSGKPRKVERRRRSR